jgi:hypothetical protein
MVKILYILIVLVFSGCGEAPPFEKFSHEEGKGKTVFLVDFENCVENKDKFSNMIQGREFGFEGQDTGFLGCMKLKGWNKKSS